MAEQTDKQTQPSLSRATGQPAPANARTLADRDIALDSPPPVHGDPAENLSPQESVIGVRTGSEASVESGTDPVLPAVGGGLSRMTEVRNKDLRERDRREREKRGPDVGVFSVSMTFPGLMMVLVDDQEPILRSGSFTGNFHEGITVRPLTEEELVEHVPSAAPADRQAVARRSQDLVKGAGQGGGGNPMKAHEARGTTSGVTQPAGGAAATSGPPTRGETSRGPTQPPERTQPLGTGGTTSRGSGR